MCIFPVHYRPTALLHLRQSILLRRLHHSLHRNCACASLGCRLSLSTCESGWSCSSANACRALYIDVVVDCRAWKIYVHRRFTPRNLAFLPDEICSQTRAVTGGSLEWQHDSLTTLAMTACAACRALEPDCRDSPTPVSTYCMHADHWLQKLTKGN